MLWWTLFRISSGVLLPPHRLIGRRSVVQDRSADRSAHLILSRLNAHDVADLTNVYPPLFLVVERRTSIHVGCKREPKHFRRGGKGRSHFTGGTRGPRRLARFGRLPGRHWQQTRQRRTTTLPKVPQVARGDRDRCPPHMPW